MIFKVSFKQAILRLILWLFLSTWIILLSMNSVESLKLMCLSCQKLLVPFLMSFCIPIQCYIKPFLAPIHGFYSLSLEGNIFLRARKPFWSNCFMYLLKCMVFWMHISKDRKTGVLSLPLVSQSCERTASELKLWKRSVGGGPLLQRVVGEFVMLVLMVVFEGV